MALGNTQKDGQSVADPAGGKRIGILGGGQLGLMLANAAKTLGIEVLVADPDPHAPASRLGCFKRVAHWAQAVQVLEERCDILTWEREDIPLDLLSALPEGRVASLAALRETQDRWAQKKLYDALQLPTAAWLLVDGPADASRVMAQLGLPVVIKARTGGFDGRGTIVARNGSELLAGLHRCADGGAIVERFVPFDDEVAITVVRGTDGRVESYDPVLTTQHGGQLAWAVAPHPLAAQVAALARRIAETLVQELGYVGAFSVEFFRCGTELIINEVAPRVHNSAHWTIDAAETSQFANHVLAVAGQPLRPAASRGCALLLNCLGEMLQPLPATPAEAHYFIHDYGKKSRPRRKVGHCTLVTTEASLLPAAWLACELNWRQQLADIDDWATGTSSVSYAGGLYPVVEPVS
jgi:5-(carboxyamino)imidazole ribonucleotide synthase